MQYLFLFDGRAKALYIQQKALSFESFCLLFFMLLFSLSAKALLNIMSPHFLPGKIVQQMYQC